MNTEKRLIVTPSPEWYLSHQREHKRIDIFATLEFRQDGDFQANVQEFTPAQVLDISAGGLLFRTKYLLSVGSMIELHLNLGDVLDDQTASDNGLVHDVDFVAKAQIRKVTEGPDEYFLYGVKFISVSKGNLKKLDEFINQHV